MSPSHHFDTAFLAIVFVTAGCRDDAERTAGSALPAASTSAVTSSAGPPAGSAAPTPTASAASASLPGESADVEKPTEHESDRLVGGAAKRASVRAVVDDAVLRANPEIVAAHFGATPPFPLEVQRVAMHGGRQAVLVAGPTEGIVPVMPATPLIIVADEAGQALWAKRRPLAGTRERVRGLSLLAGPEGSLAIAWWDEPTRAVALRRWDFDGSVFADYHLFDSDAADALDAVYWPGHGWIVTVTVLREGAARAQLVTESGLGGFGGAVLEVTSSERVTSRASAAASGDGIFHAYLARPTGPSPATENPSLWVALHRLDGSAAWKAPVKVAPMRAGVDPHAEPIVTLETAAILRVEVGGETYKIASSGHVLSKPDGAGK